MTRHTWLPALLLLSTPAFSAEPLKLTGHTRELYALAFSSAGDKLASTANDGTLRVWTLADGSAVVIRTGFPSRTVAFSPDGKLVAGRFETGAGVWNSANGTLVARLAGRDTSADNTVRRVAFSPDGKWLAVGHEYGLVRLWNVATRTPDAELARPGRVGGPAFCVTALAFSPDGQWLAVGSEKGLAVWNLATREVVATSAESARTLSVGFTPDGAWLLVNESDRVGHFRVWRVSNWMNVLTTDRIGTPEQHLSDVTAVTDALALGVNEDSRFEFFDLGKGVRTGVRFPTPYQSAPDRFAVSPDRKSVAHYFGGNIYTIFVEPLPAAK